MMWLRRWLERHALLIALLGFLVAFGLLMDQVATFRSGGGLFPDWESGEQFVLEMFGITADEIIALAQEPGLDAP